MLVLSRKIDERIQIGDGITITVVDIQGGKVRLGIEAPPRVGIWRTELIDQCPGLRNVAKSTLDDARRANAGDPAATTEDTTAAGKRPDDAT